MKFHNRRADHQGIREFTLDNGLKVILLENHKVPAATFHIWYRTYYLPANACIVAVGDFNTEAKKYLIGHFPLQLITCDSFARFIAQVECLSTRERLLR